MRIAARLGGKEEPERTSVHRYRSVTGTGTPTTSLVSGSSFPFPLPNQNKALSSRATQKKAGRPAAPFFLAASIENPSAASDQSQMRKRQWESCIRSERLFSTLVPCARSVVVHAFSIVSADLGDIVLWRSRRRALWRKC